MLELTHVELKRADILIYYAFLFALFDFISKPLQLQWCSLDFHIVYVHVFVILGIVLVFVFRMSM